MKRVVKSIPNGVTLLNLLAGVGAIILTQSGNILLAIYLLILAMLFDFLDGLLARILDAYSEIGKELDSLADLVSFGVAPALMLFYRVATLSNRYIASITLIVAAATAYRLARFNSDPSQSVNFKGVPAPAGALLIISTLHLSTIKGASHPIFSSWYLYIALALMTSYLMVSKVEMFSLKGVNINELKKSRPQFTLFQVSVVALVITLAISWPLSLWLLTTLIWYIVYNLIASLKTKS